VVSLVELVFHRNRHVGVGEHIRRQPADRDG
jgi:hypothetical protein